MKLEFLPDWPDAEADVDKGGVTVVHWGKTWMKQVVVKCLLFCLLVLVGCGGGPTANSSPTVTPLPDFTQHGTAVLANVGHPDWLTTVAFEPSTSGCVPGQDWHHTKNAAGTYWTPGTDGAEIHWITHQQSSGGWNAHRSLITSTNPMYSGWGKSFTVDYEPVAGGDGPEYAYQVLPTRDDLVRIWFNGETIKRVGYAQWYLDAFSWRDTCMIGVPQYKLLDPAQPYAWVVIYSAVDVDTPIYKGRALREEQFEGCVTYDNDCYRSLTST